MLHTQSLNSPHFPPALSLVAWPLALCSLSSLPSPPPTPHPITPSSPQPDSVPFWDPNFLGFEKWTAPGVPPRSQLRNGVRLTSLFYLGHRYLIIPPSPEMVLQSSENPSKMGFLSRVPHAANEANAPLFSHFHRRLFPILLPKAIARSSCVQMHQPVSVPASTPAPQGSARLQPFLLGPFADCARPSSRFMAHSALSPAHVLPKAAFKSFQCGAPPRGQRPPSGFTLVYYANFGFQASRDQDQKEELSEPE